MGKLAIGIITGILFAIIFVWSAAEQFRIKKQWNNGICPKCGHPMDILGHGVSFRCPACGHMGVV